MLRVGITGNIGSGKTTASRIFAMLGAAVYSADERAKHFLHTPGTIERIKKEFGEGCIGADGAPDKKKLAEIVFEDETMLQKLNDIIHPQVRRDFDTWAAQKNKYPYVMMEAAILFESGQSRRFDKVVLVTAPEHLRIERVCKRDNVSPDDVKKRMRHQMDEATKIPLADFVIVNDEKQMLISQAEAIHKKLLELAGEINNVGGK